MNWTGQNEIRTALLRLWDRGDLLRDSLTGHQRFPLRIALRGPNTRDITERFDTVRRWSAEIAALANVRVEWKVVRHRIQGEQQLPAAVWFDSCDDALRWLGKRRELHRFDTLIAPTLAQCPAVIAWMHRRPLQALSLADIWPQLLAVASWRLAHPAPGIYLRQVDVPGVHTKFIEAHRATLCEWLDLLLDAGQIHPQYSGVANFALRYGFTDKPVRVRLRVLDTAIAVVAKSDVGERRPANPGPTGLPAGADITLDIHTLGQLPVNRWPLHRVVITENETNFLALPPLRGTLALFGAGYGWDALARVAWLQQCDIDYWGDIDTHGFAILHQLRRYLPHARSILMDRATLEAHRSFWNQEPRPTHARLTNLTAEENEVYELLCNNHFADRVRLEQERISYQWAQRYLEGASQT